MKKLYLPSVITLLLTMNFSLFAEGLSPERKAEREKSYLSVDAKLINFEGIVSQNKQAKDFQYILTQTESGEKLQVNYEHSDLFVFNSILKKALGKKVKLRGVLDAETKAVNKIISVIPAASVKLSTEETRLNYKDAEVNKTGLRIGTKGANHFRREGITLTWRVDSEAGGKFLLSIFQSCRKAGAKYEISCNKQLIEGTVTSTGKVKNLKKFDLEEINLVKGENTIQFKILTMSTEDNSKAGINLECLILSKKEDQ